MDNINKATKPTPKGLKKIERPDRRAKFGVQWRDSGKRKFRFFQEEGDRDKYFADHTRKKPVEDFSLSEWNRWVKIREEADEIGITPEAALQVARKYRLEITAPEITLQEATAAYIRDAERRGRSEDYIRHLRSFFQRLVDCIGGNTPLLEITRDTLQTVFDGLGVGAITQKNYKAYTNALFVYAKDEGWLTVSPVERLVVAEATAEEPGILTPEQTKAFLKAAQDISPEFAALAALQCFAGIRNANVTRFELGEIDRKAKRITIPANKFKTKKRHVIEDANPNLWMWIAKADMKELCNWTARNYNWRKSQAFKAAKITPPKNCLRHSFASYRCALDGSADKASYILGHQNPREIWQAYKATASRADARKYFAIKPEAVK